ncbi:MAG: methyltransferase domain-containing protein [Dermatophilaceae bacterium]
MPGVHEDRADGSSSQHGHNHAGHREGDGSGDETSDETFWDQRYGSSSALWSGRANSHLVTEVSGLSPGSALDVGCGEGGDAIWLAQQGWQVTAADISAVALGRGAAHALEISLEVEQRIRWMRADLTEWVPPAESFDLVSAQFMHLPKKQRETIYRRIVASVVPGGTLLVVGHHPFDLQTSVPRPSVPGLLFTASEVAALLPAEQWVILVEEARARQTLDPDGRTVTVHDSVLRARRVS